MRTKIHRIEIPKSIGLEFSQRGKHKSVRARIAQTGFIAFNRFTESVKQLFSLKQLYTEFKFSENRFSKRRSAVLLFFAIKIYLIFSSKYSIIAVGGENA